MDEFDDTDEEDDDEVTEVKRVSKPQEDDDEDDSDFEDPDEIEIPGGGKSLAQVKGTDDEQPTVHTPLAIPMNTNGNGK